MIGCFLFLGAIAGQEVFLETTQQDFLAFIEPPSTQMCAMHIEEENHYEKLRITMEEKQKIARILTTMAENNVFKLLFEKKRLERLGQEVNHVHPIRFLGTVFSDPRLCYCMRKIRRSGFKWDGFMNGFSNRLKQEVKANNVQQYLPGLASSLHVNMADLQVYINDRNYEGLVLFLMNRSR